MIPQTPDPDQTRLEATCSCGSSFVSCDVPDEDERAEFDDWQAAHENCGVVDLDPPTPLPEAVVHWTELVAHDHHIDHRGDASKVIPFPRPAWSDLDEDHVGNSVVSSYFRSSAVRVAASLSAGLNDATYLERGHARISAKKFGDGTTFITLATRRMVGEKWVNAGIDFTTAEATELATVLLAAVDLVRDEQPPQITGGDNSRPW